MSHLLTSKPLKFGLNAISAISSSIFLEGQGGFGPKLLESPLLPFLLLLLLNVNLYLCQGKVTGVARAYFLLLGNPV